MPKIVVKRPSGFSIYSPPGGSVSYVEPMRYIAINAVSKIGGQVEINFRKQRRCCTVTFNEYENIRLFIDFLCK